MKTLYFPSERNKIVSIETKDDVSPYRYVVGGLGIFYGTPIGHERTFKAISVLFEQMAISYGGVWLIDDYNPQTEMGDLLRQYGRLYLHFQGEAYPNPKPQASPLSIGEGFGVLPEYQKDFEKYNLALEWKDEEIIESIFNMGIALLIGPERELKLANSSFVRDLESCKTANYSQFENLSGTEEWWREIDYKKKLIHLQQVERTIAEISLKYFKHVLRSSDDGQYVVGYVRELSDIEDLYLPLQKAIEIVISDPWYRENSDKYIWDEEKQCLQLKE